MKNFRYAYEGLLYALSTQRNMKFHFFITLIVLIAAWYFHLSKFELLWIALSIALVIITEMFNTALEKTVDLASPDIHPLAKIAKDVSAAAVLVASIFAVIVGVIIFYEYLEELMQHLIAQ